MFNDPVSDFICLQKCDYFMQMPFVLLNPFWNNNCFFSASIDDVNIWRLNSNLQWRGGWTQYIPCIYLLKWPVIDSYIYSYQLFISASTCDEDDLQVDICVLYLLFDMQVSLVLLRLFWNWHTLLTFSIYDVIIWRRSYNLRGGWNE